jgi:hypothetical protein
MRSSNMRSLFRPFLWMSLAVSLLFLLDGRAVTAGPPGPEGRWKGAIIFTPGEQELGIAVELSRRPDGSLAGTLSIPSHDIVSDPLEDVAVDGSLVSFVYRDRASVQVLNGTLSADGRSIAGQLSGQDGGSHSFELAREDAATPAPALVDLGGIAGFKKVFNDDAGNPRVVAILSPTCALCLRNAEMIERRLLDRLGDPSLKVYVVWVPAMGKEDRKVTQTRTSLLVDPRATHYWAEDMSLAEAFKQPLGMKSSSAWDVFLVFRPGVRWGEAAPRPDLYMHRQEKELPADRRFHAIRFADEVERLLWKK